MAKINGPLLSLGASGSVADAMTFAKWKGRPYVRQRVIPANPQSTAQVTTRKSFSNANEIWKLMASLGIAPWDRFASGQVLTGRNAFMGRFVEDNRGLADLQAMVFSPGAKGGLAPESLALTPISQGINTVVVAPAAPTGWTLQAAVATAILDQDPETGTDWETDTLEDVAAPFAHAFGGLLPLTQYVVGAWLRWAKPDGSIAYGASISDFTTTLA